MQAATAWPTSLLQALRVHREFKAGCVWINDHISILSELPLEASKRLCLGKNTLNIYPTSSR